MDYGIKISQQNVDVISNIKNKPSSDTQESKAHILLTLAIPYLNGANEQITRYETAASQLNPQNAVNVVNTCLHEASSLFEDVCTISKYLSKLCGYTNEKDQLWLDTRNHIRHDVRENFDTTNENDIEWRKKRLNRLGISDEFQTSIGFDKDRISIGTTTITMNDVRQYLLWSSQIITDIIAQAESDGKIERS